MWFFFRDLRLKIGIVPGNPGRMVILGKGNGRTKILGSRSHVQFQVRTWKSTCEREPRIFSVPRPFPGPYPWSHLELSGLWSLSVYNVCSNHSIGRLLTHQQCGLDNFESCGIVDKSSYWARWAIIAEEYSDTSSSKCILALYVIYDLQFQQNLLLCLTSQLNTMLNITVQKNTSA